MGFIDDFAFALKGRIQHADKVGQKLDKLYQTNTIDEFFLEF